MPRDLLQAPHKANLRIRRLLTLPLITLLLLLLNLLSRHLFAEILHDAPGVIPVITVVVHAQVLLRFRIFLYA